MITPADGSEESRKLEALQAAVVRWARESQLERKVALHANATVFFPLQPLLPLLSCPGLQLQRPNCWSCKGVVNSWRACSDLPNSKPPLEQDLWSWFMRIMLKRGVAEVYTHILISSERSQLALNCKDFEMFLGQQQKESKENHTAGYRFPLWMRSTKAGKYKPS